MEESSGTLKRRTGRSKHMAVGAIVATAVVVLAGGAIGAWQYYSHRSPIPADIRAAVNFPLYYPSALPPSFKLDKESFSATGTVVIFRFTYDKNKSLAVSIQPRNPGPDENSFNPTKKFTTNIGTAYEVDMDDRTTAAVVGDKSWMLINAPQKISVDMLEQFINNLRSVTP